MAIYGPLNSGAAVGDNGLATISATSTAPLVGFVNWVYIKYNDSPPAATTDVAIATLGTSPSAPSRAILTIANAATAGYFHPRINAVDQTGSAISGVYEMIPIHDYVKVTVTGANAADNVDIWLDIVPV